MSVFTPNIILKDVTRIDLALLKANGIEGLILDVDNTLTTHGNQYVRKDIKLWLAKMRENNIKLIIVSNNTQERVQPFADMLKLPFVAMAMKPLTFGFRKATKELELPEYKMAVIGDQIYTDIVGGNLAGMYTILVNPMMIENNFFFRCKRALETIHRKEYYKRKEAVENDKS